MALATTGPITEVSTRFPEWTTTRFSSDGRFLAFGQVNVDGPAQGIHVFDRLAGRSPVQVELRAGESVSSLAFDDRRKLLVFTIEDLMVSASGFTNSPTSRPSRRRASSAQLSQAVPVVGWPGRVRAEPGRNRAFRPRDGASLGSSRRCPGGNLLACEVLARRAIRCGRVGKPDSRLGNGGGPEDRTRPGRGGLVAFEWSPRGRFLAWGAEDGRLAILEPASGRVRELLSGSSTQKIRGRGLSFSSDERLLAVSTDWVPGGPRPAEVWDLDRGRKIWEFPGRNEGVPSVSCPADTTCS